MRQSPIHLAIGFLLSLAALPLTGCTLIGYGIGASIDLRNPALGAPVPSLAKMENGDLYQVVKIDSSVVIGRYVRTFVAMPQTTQLEVEDPYDEAQESYNQWRDADSSRRNMPRCLDSLLITLNTPVPRYWRGRLDRISTDSLWVIGYGGLRPPIHGISLQEVRTLMSTTGGRIEGQDLRNTAAGMTLSPPTSPPLKKVTPREFPPTEPLPSIVLLTIDGYETPLPVDSIAHVSSMDIPCSARWVWMGVGMLVDAVVVGGVYWYLFYNFKIM